MKIPKPVQVLYAIIGILYLLIGIGAMLAPPGWLPQKLVGEFLLGQMREPFVAHLTQEFGTVVLVVGVLFLWRARQPRWSPAFHWAMTGYFVLNAVIHWVDPHGEVSSWSRGLVNSLPPVLMVLAGMLQPGKEQAPAATRRAHPPTQSAGDTMAIDILAAGAERTPRDPE